MACEAWNEHLVARLYGEMDEAEEGRLAAHLTRCAACRAELGQLGAARDRLRQAKPALPASPRVVLLAPRPLRRPVWAFAAGFACALLVLVAGLGAGWTLRGREGQGNAPAAPIAAALTREEVEGRLREHEAALDRRLGTTPWVPSGSPASGAESAVTKKDLEAAFSRLEKKLDSRRATDIGYVLDAISASELRSSARIGQTREALRYVALASDPRISAQ
jgi:predicted anti-sigma-YlaC factor YlaD